MTDDSCVIFVVENTSRLTSQIRKKETNYNPPDWDNYEYVPGKTQRDTPRKHTRGVGGGVVMAGRFMKTGKFSVKGHSFPFLFPCERRGQSFYFDFFRSAGYEEIFL